MSRRTNIDAGPLLAVAGALLLLVSLFLDWYEPGVSAWTVFELIDLLLAFSALVAILVSLELIRPELLRLGRVPAAERVLMTAGTVAFVLVASQLLNHPPAAQHEAVKLGAWLALGGSTLMLVGGIATIAWVSLRVTFDRRPAAATPPPPPPPAAPPPPPRPPREPGSTQETSELP
jgi:hypothetical protein